MNSQPFTLRIEHPAPEGPSGHTAAAPLLLTGRCEAFWHRPLWLNPSFWEVHRSNPLDIPAEANCPDFGCGQCRSAAVWVGLRLGTLGRGWTIQAGGQTNRLSEEIPLREPLAFSVTDGQVNLPPFHVRLPPGLTFQLAWEATHRLQVDLAHPTLGSIFSMHVHPVIQNITKEPNPC